MTRLSKWYLDCVDPDGRVVIGYWAKLTCGPVRLEYSSLLFSTVGMPVRSRTRFRSHAGPCRDGERVVWRPKALGLSGTWRAETAAFSSTLLDRADGRIDWHCVHPRSATEVSLDGIGTIRGSGYVERLELTLPPWRIPIDELRWGRFLGAHTSAVWIEWRGPMPMRLLWINGSETEADSLGDGEIGFSHQRLFLDRRRTLRTGLVAQTALHLPRPPCIFLPARVRDMGETKWLSRGRLGDETGWAIHEHVTWGGGQSLAGSHKPATASSSPSCFRCF